MTRASANVKRGRKMPRWTMDQVAVLRLYYADADTAELAEFLGHSHGAARDKAHALGLRKSKAFLERMGRENIKSRWPAKP